MVPFHVNAILQLFLRQTEIFFLFVVFCFERPQNTIMTQQQQEVTFLFSLNCVRCFFRSQIVVINENILAKKLFIKWFIIADAILYLP